MANIGTDQRAHRHQTEADTHHQMLAEAPAEQTQRQGGKYAKQHERADQRAQGRVVDAELVDQVGADAADGLELVAEGDTRHADRQ